jgi:hypothetical protein
MPDYSGAEKFILEKLKGELSPKLTYHGIHHTFDVMNAAMQIAAAEKITPEEISLLRVGVGFHDAGFLFVYRGHEERGCEMALEFLPGFGFTPGEIELVQGMIRATRLPQTPATQLERIIADADLDYLGRNDFYPIGATLFEEFKLYLGVKDEAEWNQIQLGFLRGHHYHTDFCKKFRSAEKQLRLDEIRELVREAADQD